LFVKLTLPRLGFCKFDENVPGPSQLYETTGLASGIALRLKLAPGQRGELLVTVEMTGAQSKN
jgi:hypothetical protein